MLQCGEQSIVVRGPNQPCVAVSQIVVALHSRFKPSSHTKRCSYRQPASCAPWRGNSRIWCIWSACLTVAPHRQLCFAASS